MSETTENAVTLIQRIQSFDVQSLPRESELGELNFHEAVPDAERLISLFRVTARFTRCYGTDGRAGLFNVDMYFNRIMTVPSFLETGNYRGSSR